VANQLTVGLPYGAHFNTYFDEMIEMAPHNTPAYAEDNARVMNILIHIIWVQIGGSAYWKHPIT